MLSISFICKDLSESFYNGLNNCESLGSKYEYLKKGKESGLNIVSCIGNHGLLNEQISFNMALKNGEQFKRMNESKGKSKKTINFWL